VRRSVFRVFRVFRGNRSFASAADEFRVFRGNRWLLSAAMKFRVFRGNNSVVIARRRQKKRKSRHARGIPALRVKIEVLANRAESFSVWCDFRELSILRSTRVL
jgi:hypothetical protein